MAVAFGSFLSAAKSQLPMSVQQRLKYFSSSFWFFGTMTICDHETTMTLENVSSGHESIQSQTTTFFYLLKQYSQIAAVSYSR